ncbi:hypothetical protein FH869_07670 [Providencia rettgeri]|uniref:hypothetical protein n=2 Tax=Morganellaceae TaxID=1903414 RepID=UPI00111D75B8|nr:hypothetical protein [Providencia sp. PROV225]TNV03523.1 hypothetical protein FH869_07670 [Providencia rettgeri]
MTDKTGGAAFPASGHPDMQFVAQEGMELRDYFAAKALNAVIIGIYNDATAQQVYHNRSADDFAKEAYTLADAMLKARG